VSHNRRLLALSIISLGAGSLLVSSVHGQGGRSAPDQNGFSLRQGSSSGVKHGVMGFGEDTFIANSGGRMLWRDSRNTRDGWLLPKGRRLLTITKSADYPHGAALELDSNGRTLFEYTGTQSEVNSVEKTREGHYVLTEAGDRPRLLELDASGKTIVEFPLMCQTKDAHMETRMARKLKNGHYLVPHLLDLAVREYDRSGKVVWEAKTPNWPFSAIRRENGNTTISCTHGNMVVEVDKKGSIIWQLTNDDLPGAPLKDACGAQLLSNGDLVITSYGSGGADEPKLTEVTPDKKIVWQLFTGRPHGLHQFEILNADGSLPRGEAAR
jgi:hypothetical protein